MKRIAAALLAVPFGRCRAVERPARKPALPVEMGRGRRARLGQPHEESRGRAARARLIKTGEVIELSHVLGPGMAFSPARASSTCTPSAPS